MPVFLSVFFRYNDKLATIVAHVLRVTVDADDPLTWIRQHADEIAYSHFKRSDYVALQVSATDDLAAAAAQGA